MAIQFGPSKPSPPPPTVVIGTQEWTLNNLDVARYRNGDDIPEIQNQAAWVAATTGAWCYYNNDSANGTIYGRLYNWYAVTDPRGLAPTGFHIPTYDEILTLRSYLGGQFAAGGPLKETGTTHWQSPNTGATNSSGWTGLPGGIRFNNGIFFGIYQEGDWWSSTTFAGPTKYGFRMQYNNIIADITGAAPENGMAVRCIKD
jgi:uncharacterized protein (TIGR02145 family)